MVEALREFLRHQPIYTLGSADRVRTRILFHFGDTRAYAASTCESSEKYRPCHMGNSVNYRLADRLPYWSMEKNSNDILDDNLIRVNACRILAAVANGTSF